MAYNAIKIVNFFQCAFLTCSLLVSVYLVNYGLNGRPTSTIESLSRLVPSSDRPNLLNNLNTSGSYFDNDDFSIRSSRSIGSEQCSMSSCFNFDRCRNYDQFKIYIYERPAMNVSKLYGSILRVLNQSTYVTHDPDKACLFVLPLDTLDRDKISKNYLKNLPDILNKLDYWKKGENFLLFNLYSGSWPNYQDTFDVSAASKAILAKASFSLQTYRTHFDVSFPLFHADLPEKHDQRQWSTSPYTVKRKYFLTFKGKRYLTGGGSETRNSIYHLNNGRDVVLLTTCKHGFNWQELKDERCDQDNELYDRYDYADLIANSTYCLIPRGRRLGTYRFLEALKVGCIPVLLSNGWVLPFSEVLDWSRAVVWTDERAITQLVDFLRRIPPHKQVEMKQTGLFFYAEYFSSVERILLTTVEILRDRIFKHTARPRAVWNTFPGVYHFEPDLYGLTPNVASESCQLIVVCDEILDLIEINILHGLMREIPFLDEVVFVKCLRENFNLTIMKHSKANVQNLNSFIKRTCVISIYAGWIKYPRLKEALTQGYKIWTSNRNSLVGYVGYSYSLSMKLCSRLRYDPDLTDGYAFISMQLMFAQEYFIKWPLMRKELWSACNKLEQNTHIFSKCLMPIVNLNHQRMWAIGNFPILIKLRQHFRLDEPLKQLCTNMSFKNQSLINEYLIENRKNFYIF